MNIMNRPICEGCGEQALGHFWGLWLCGKCIEKADKKLKEEQKLKILEGLK